MSNMPARLYGDCVFVAFDNPITIPRHPGDTDTNAARYAPCRNIGSAFLAKTMHGTQLFKRSFAVDQVNKNR